MNRMESHRLGVIVALALGLSACASVSAKPVPLAKVDLQKVYGGWYIVACIPNFLDRGSVDNYDYFAPGPGGRIVEQFWTRRGGFDRPRMHLVGNIEIVPGSDNADWRVGPWPLRVPFQVLWADPDGRWLLFGEQNREWGWVYSRKPQMSDSEYAEMLGHFGRLGYDASKFLRTVQSPDQIGRAGYWSDGIRPVLPKASNEASRRASSD